MNDTPESCPIIKGRRFNAIIVASFASISLFIAVIGVYGILAFAVSQRTQEIGIRLALGSGTQRIYRLLLQDGIGPVVIGLSIGAFTAVALTRYVKSPLYGISATDPLTFAGVVVALTLVAVVAIPSQLCPPRASIPPPHFATNKFTSPIGFDATKHKPPQLERPSRLNAPFSRYESEMPT